jgi:hypothetical protein
MIQPAQERSDAVEAKRHGKRNAGMFQAQDEDGLE